MDAIRERSPFSRVIFECSNRSGSYLFYFYFICHTIITKKKEEKKKWRGDLTETIGAHERLGLLEL